MNVDIFRVNGHGNESFSRQADKNIFIDRKKIPTFC